MTTTRRPDAAGRGRALADRLHDLLLRAYPVHVRRRFGADMRATFAAERAAARARGRLALVSCWIAGVVEALRFGAQARLDARSRRSAASGSHTDRGASAVALTQAVHMDVRHAVRLLARQPAFTAAAVLSLAIGLAAFTTIAGIGDALLLQAAPGVRGADRLIDVARSTHGAGDAPLTRTMFDTLRARTRTVESMAAVTRQPVPLSLHDEAGARRVFGQTVSAGYFDVLQARPALGRFFSPDEDVTGAPRPVVVLSHDAWRKGLERDTVAILGVEAPGGQGATSAEYRAISKRGATRPAGMLRRPEWQPYSFPGPNSLGADPRVLDRPVRLNGVVVDVVGVAEPGFHGTTILGADLWMPMALARSVRGGGDTPGDDTSWPWSDARAVARLDHGSTRDAARAELNAILAALRTERSSIPDAYGIAVDPGGRLPPRARPQFATFVALIAVLAGGLLAVACTNVNGMLIARATTRRYEVAMRLSLGASRGQIVRQLLLETLALFALAAIVALPVVWWLTPALSRFIPANLPLPIRFDVAMSYRHLAFGMGAAALAALACGLAPARQALASDLSQVFAGRSATDGRARLRLRNALVVAQVALSLAMAITAALLVRTLQAAAHVDIGFRTSQVMMATVDTSMLDVRGDDAIALVGRLAAELQAIGGVEAVGHGRLVPLEGNSLSLGAVRAAAGKADRSIPSVDWEVVSPDYFRAVGLPIVAGRAFGPEDRPGGPDVVIVNESFARAAWPQGSAVGRQVRHTDATSRQERVLEVVGVARDARYRYVSEPPRPMLYRPFVQAPQTPVHFYVAHAPGVIVSAAIRQAVARVEPRLPVVLLRSFDEAAAVSLLPQRFAAWVAGGVGSIGTCLAALGLYAVVAFLVAQRTREIAIRMALGATPARVRGMVLRQAVRLGIAGTSLGMLLAWMLGRFVQRAGLLIGTSPSDPLTFALVAAGMGLVILAASYLPTRRAVATAPAAVLRAQ